MAIGGSHICTFPDHDHSRALPEECVVHGRTFIGDDGRCHHTPAGFGDCRFPLAGTAEGAAWVKERNDGHLYEIIAQLEAIGLHVTEVG